MIYRTAAACRDMENALNTRFHFKITTNGTLLDREFLDYSKKNRILIALSHDGTKKAHDFSEGIRTEGAAMTNWSP